MSAQSSSLSFPRKRESTSMSMDSLLRRKDIGLPHKHGSELTLTWPVTELFCESLFDGLTVARVRVDSRFRGNDSVGEGIGVVGTVITNTNDYNQGKVDRFQYSASLLVDALSTVAIAAIAGAVAGGTTAAVAGAVGGAVVLPIVGAVPGAIIGGILGAVAGAVVGVVGSLAFNNARVIPTDSGNISLRDASVNGLADGLNSFTGWFDNLVSP